MRGDLHRRLARLEQGGASAGTSYVVRMAASVADDEEACAAAVVQALGAAPKPEDTLVIIRHMEGCAPALVNSWRSSTPGRAGR